MIFELIATGLLAYGVSISSLNVNNGNHYDSNDNHISESIKPKYASNLSNQLVSGIYNFRDSFDFGIFDIRDIGGNTIIFDNDYNFLVPFTYDANNEPTYYLKTFTYYVGDEEEVTTNYIYVSFQLYDIDTNELSLDVDIYSTDTLASVQRLEEVRTLMFYVINGVNLNPQDYKVFNFLFTHDDNTFMRSYIGYYSFINNGILFNGNHYNIFGTSTIGNSISFTFDFYSIDGYSINSIERLTYDVLGQNYTISSFIIPKRPSNFVYFDNVKMSISTYTALNGTLGSFSYMPSTSQPTSFEDLLFGIADSNLYFIASLFNFEMFGMNLYIALSGLLTLVIVIFIIRKIW